MGTNVSAGALLLICIAYSIKHRGADWPAVLLGVCFGSVASKSTAAPLINAVTDLIVGIVQAIINAIGAKFGGGGGGTGPVPVTPDVATGLNHGLVALRYNAGLFLGR